MPSIPRFYGWSIIPHARGVQFMGEDAVDMGGVRESPQSGLGVLKKGESLFGGKNIWSYTHMIYMMFVKQE